MDPGQKDHVEIASRNRWDTVSVEDAIGNESPKRCSECHGRVRVHKRSVDGMRTHFEHLIRHDGCSLSYRYSGHASMHPDALK